MIDPTKDSLRDALRSWDPATHVKDQQSEEALDEVRREFRRAVTQRDLGRTRWSKLTWAAAVAFVVFALTLVLVGRQMSWFGRHSGAVVATSRSEVTQPLRLTLVASNGVRVYWAILPETTTTPISDSSNDVGRTP